MEESMSNKIISLEKCKELFETFCKGKKDFLSADDLVHIKKQLGENITKNDAEKLIEEYDTQKKGGLNFEDFTNIMKGNNDKSPDMDPEETKEEKVLKSFKVFDKNNSGKISVDEFKVILTKIGNKRFREKDCEVLFKMCDLDDDGYLAYNDLVNFFKEY